MGLKVEVFSKDKDCLCIIDLDAVIEVAPLSSGGCALFFDRNPSIAPMYVTNAYAEFKQFVVQTISSDDIAKRVQSLKSPTLEEYPTLAPAVSKVEAPKGRGRPALNK